MVDGIAYPSGHLRFTLQVLKQRMAALQAADDTKRAAARAKNNLESYIIARRSALQVC